MAHRCHFKRVAIFLILIVALFSSGCSDDIQEPGYDRDLARQYEIVNTEEMDIKSLAIVIKRYRVIVPSDITEEELKVTLIQIVEDKISEDPDIDQVIVLAYDRLEDISDDYTLGKVEWRPDAEWNGATSMIAATNDRSSYQYIFEISDTVKNGANKGNAMSYETNNDRLERSRILIEEHFK